MKTSWTIPLAILVGGGIVAMATYISVSHRFPSLSQTDNSSLVRPVDMNDHMFGNPAAPVQIIEYTDFDCTYCRTFHEVLRQVIANEGARGEIAWVLREFPLIELHENAFQNAEAAECAGHVGGNDAFWRFADILFAGQPNNPTRYGTYAQEAGISGTEFATCLMNASTTVADRILADRQNALAIGAKGTPYSLILVEGREPVIVDGSYPYSVLKDLIDQALANRTRSQ